MKYLVELSDGSEERAIRDGFGKALLEAGDDSKIVVITADVSESVRVQDFAKKYPERFIDVGVAEQNLAGVAAGLALSGKKAIAASYAAFSPGRNWDQVRVSIAYSQVPVLLVGSHAGLTVGEDGATHQALEDIAIVRALPNMTVVVPSDYVEAELLTKQLIEYDRPTYMRLAREKSPILFNSHYQPKVGKAEVLTVGDDVTVFACGEMVAPALAAAKEYDGEVAVRVVNVHTLKPIDIKTITECLNQTQAAVTAENHQKIGGLGSAIAEIAAGHCPTPIEMIGVSDTFGRSGRASELLHDFGLTKEDIAHAIKKVLERKHAYKP